MAFLATNQKIIIYNQTIYDLTQNKLCINIQHYKLARANHYTTYNHLQLDL